MNNIDYIAVGARIKELRIAKGKEFTQSKISEMLGCSQKHYGDVERGETGLSVELAAKLKDIFGTSLDYLYLGELPNIENPETIGIINKLNTIPYKSRYISNKLVHGLIDIILQAD